MEIADDGDIGQGYFKVREGNSVNTRSIRTLKSVPTTAISSSLHYIILPRDTPPNNLQHANSSHNQAPIRI